MKPFSYEKLYSDYYINNIPPRIISLDHKCSKANVYYWLKKYKIPIKEKGITKSSKYFNHDYFKTWSHNMAWMLGFIQADGCIASDKKHFTLMIGLADKDIEILEFIRNEICSDKKIYKNQTTLKSNGKTYTGIRLNLNSKILVKDLLDIGIQPSKTGKETPLDIPEQFLYSYIRGYFDGDGSVGIYKYDNNKHKQYNFQITCQSQTFLEYLQSKLIYCKIRKRNNIFDLITNSKKNMIKIYNKLYSTEGFYLKRKKDIFERIVHENQPSV